MTRPHNDSEVQTSDGALIRTLLCNGIADVTFLAIKLGTDWMEARLDDPSLITRVTLACA